MRKEIYGIEKLSFVDFPERPAIVIYFAGCNLRCQFCFNSDVVGGLGKEIYSLSETKQYADNMRESIGSLGIVFSGGEPTVNPYFEGALELFKDYPLAIHTNGIVKPAPVENPYEAVVFSIKPFLEVTTRYGLSEYIYLLARTVKYYSSCKNKEFRIVDSLQEGVLSAFGILYELKNMTMGAPGWNVRIVDNKKIEKGVAV